MASPVAQHGKSKRYNHHGTYYESAQETAVRARSGLLPSTMQWMDNNQTTMENRIPVLVTTKHRGVFFGFALQADLEKTSIRLERCRCAIRWNTAPKGFLALASDGPNDGSRVGAEAQSVLLHDVTSVATCSEKASNAWTSHA